MVAYELVSHDPEPVAERIAVGAANRDLFTINNKLMNFDHADMPDTHNVRFMYPDKIRRRYKVKNVTHIFTDQYVSRLSGEW
jgi:hypothetical protein